MADPPRAPLPRAPLRWDRSQVGLLDELWRMGDHDVDRVVAEVGATGDPAGLYRWIMADLATSTTGGDPWVERHLGGYPALPAWVDHDLLRQGQEFFLMNLWSINVGFLLSSLPLSYCGADGAAVLHQTGMLRQGSAQRRIFETALLVTELAEQDGFRPPDPTRPAGNAYLTLLRLRVLHAAARHVIRDGGVTTPAGETVPWDESTRGAPVSQLDLLGTVGAFALGSLRALERADPGSTEPHRDAWAHLWSLAGHLIGVTDRSSAGPLLPMDHAEMTRCFEAVARRQFRSSPEGEALTAEVVRLGRAWVPFQRMDDLVEALLWDHLEGRAGMLGVPLRDDPALVARARWVWLLTRDDAPPPGVRYGRGRVRRALVRKWLLRRLAHELICPGRRQLRTAEATSELFRTYRSALPMRRPHRWRRCCRVRVSGEGG